MFRPGHAGVLHPAGRRRGARGRARFSPGSSSAACRCGAFPDMAALWVLGLGSCRRVLATLSLITRKNSRHPLLVVGLAALGITYLSLAHHAAPGGRERAHRGRRPSPSWKTGRSSRRRSRCAGSGIYIGLVAVGGPRRRSA